MGWSPFGGPEFHDPSKSAMPYMQQIPETISPYYQPYIDQGTQAGGVMSPQYGQMSTDPGGYYNQMMSGYEPSDAYQYQSGQMQDVMSANAAAGGFTGTEYDQQRQAEALQGLMSKDQQQYYGNVTGAQQYGLGGEQHMYDVGYGASGGLASSLGSNLAQQAGLAYKGTDYMNKHYDDRHADRGQNMQEAAGMAAMIAML